VRGKEPLAGVLIGTAAALRIYPVVLVLMLATAGRWRALAASLVTIAAWVGVGIVGAGSEQTIQFVRLLVDLSGAEGGTSDLAFHGPLRVASVAAGVGLLAWSGFLIRTARPAAQAILAYGLGCAGMLLVAPVVWDHYLTALLPLVVGVSATLGMAWPGLLSVGFTTAALAGAYAIVWAPIVGVVAVLRERRSGRLS
jgi:alpha-1,2-mannosyltransferase